jgi:glutathione S-transferase
MYLRMLTKSFPKLWMQCMKLAIDFLKMVPAEEYPNINAWYSEIGKRPAAAKAYKE